jgi:K+-transporting ATPase ATPase B chain
MDKKRDKPRLLDWPIIRWAVVAALRKLNPLDQWHNPVMFVVYVGSVLTTILGVHATVARGEAPAGFIFAVSLWLWFTVLFANFAEAMAEGRAKAHAGDPTAAPEPPHLRPGRVDRAVHRHQVD